MTAVNYQEDTLKHTIAVALALAAALNQRALLAICKSSKMTERAAGMILAHALREMISNHEPSAAEFTRLMHEVASLAKES